MAHRSRFIGAGATVLAAGLLVALPSFSSGATVQNDLRSFPAAKPRVAHTSATPRTEPPLHGTNPHAQGTAAVVDVTPSAARPFTVDEAGTSSVNEDIVIGRSRGERRANGDYHGHITAAALFGNEIIEVADTGPGERQQGSLLAAVLDPLCTSTRICLGVVEYDSNTTATGSTNAFRTLSASLGGPVALPGVPGLPPLSQPSLSIGAASSFANIGHTSNCQTATGGSRVANVAAGPAPLVGIAESSSQSIACNALGTSSQTNTSRVVDINGAPVALLGAACAGGTPDTTVLAIALVEIVCNAEDSSTSGGTQADSPAHVYGVRNALDVYVLAVGAVALAQVSTAQSESLAVVPAAATTTTTTTTTTTPAATTPVPAPAATTTTPTGPATADDGGGTGDTGDEAGNEGAGDEGAGDDGAGAGTPECSDGVDNDGDGKIDFGSDPGCSSASDDSEADNVSLAGNQLPFTGTDVVVLGLAGSLLLAAGLMLHGPARRREHGS